LQTDAHLNISVNQRKTTNVNVLRRAIGLCSL